MSSELEAGPTLAGTDERAVAGHTPRVGRPRRQALVARSMKVVLFSASLLASLLVAELLVRGLGLDQALVWEPDRTIGWRQIPGARRLYTEEGRGLIEINRLGFRDRERTPEKSPGVFRVVVLGDSTTEAIQVDREQVYTSLLEKSLSEERSVEVLNLGVSGYSPIQELIRLRAEAFRLDPDLLVLGLFLDNDISGCHPSLSTTPEAPFARLDGNRLVIETAAPARSYADYHREPWFTLRRSSGLFRAVGHLRRAWKDRRRSGVSSGDAIPKRFELYRDGDPDPLWAAAWRTFEAVLLEFRDESKRAGIPLVLVSIPAAQVVVPTAWEATLARHPAMTGRTWQLDAPEERLAAFAREQGLDHLRPSAAFAEAPTEPLLYFGSVGHMTAAGHRRLSESLLGPLAARIGGEARAEEGDRTTGSGRR